MIDGRLVLDEGRITTVDERAVSDRVEVLARDEVRRAGLTIENRWRLRPGPGLDCPDPDWCRHVDPPRVRHDVMRERRPRRARLGYGRGRDSLGGAARDCRTA